MEATWRSVMQQNRPIHVRDSVDVRTARSERSAASIAVHAFYRCVLSGLNLRRGGEAKRRPVARESALRVRKIVQDALVAPRFGFASAKTIMPALHGPPSHYQP